MMKNMANILTALRIVLAGVLLLVPPFSALFWGCYLCAGLSDVLDGIVARGLKQQSEFGAKLDSAADLVFACAIACVMLAHCEFPAWLWICGACIALLRCAGYGIGYRKYRSFSSLHTYANKAAGAMLFLFPLSSRFLGIALSGALLCLAAALSALEELLIVLRSDRLNRDRRSIFFE